MFLRRRLMLQRRNVQPNYDIMVWAAAGYDGVVRLNGADFQLTQSSSDSELWYGTAPSSVTAMDYFMKHNNTTNYNSTSVYIKKVKFGTGMFAKTASCTTLYFSFACSSSDCSNLTKIDVTNINTGNVTSMTGAFANMNYLPLKEIIGVENFNTGKVTDFRNMFLSSYIKNKTLDLKGWHVLSSANIAAMFGTLDNYASKNISTCFFYTPGYWAKDPLTNISGAHCKPVVYPYHDITVAANSSYTGAAKVNGSDVTLTKNATLGIWYYDLPSGTTLTSLSNAFRNNITSISVRKGLNESPDGVNMNSFASTAANLYTVYFGIKKINNNIAWLFDYGNSGSALLNSFYGLDEADAPNDTFITAIVRGCPVLRFVCLPSMSGTTSSSNQPFRGCTNLTWISNLPGIKQEDTNFCYGCSSLTTISEASPIYENVSFADSPLTLASAKVILNALQTVTSKTITFSSTTLSYIFQDDDALELVRQAKLKGWNVANTNRLITGTVASGVTSIKLRINNNSAKDVTVTCTNGRFAYNVTENITTIRNILSQSSGQVTSIDFSNCDLSTCTAAINTFLNQTVLTKISLRGCNTSNITNWQGCFATNTGTSAIQEIDFRGCTFSSGITNVQYLFMNATALTTFLTDEDTHINQNWDMSPCSSLSLQSAKNVLSALGSVSKTADFHANAQDKIAGDYEAKVLLGQARQRGWTIAIASTIKGTVTSSTSSISLKINGSRVSVPCSGGKFSYRTTATITSLNQLLYNNRTILTIDMHQMDLYSCTNMGDMFNTAMSLTSAIVKELDTRNVTTMYAMFNYCPPLASLDVSKLDTRSVANFTYFCGYNGNITSLSELPAIYSVADTSNMFVSCSGLTTINAVGEGGISATLDMGSCPLSLDSAKVILRALQTVSQATLTFSATTIGYINSDSEALSLVDAARNKGWTIPLS